MRIPVLEARKGALEKRMSKNQKSLWVVRSVQPAPSGFLPPRIVSNTVTDAKRRRLPSSS